MLDILEGDILVVGGRDYPIKSCAEWSTPLLSVSNFKRMAKLTASTKRSQTTGAGVNRMKGVPSVLLTGLPCTYLDPVDADTRKRLALETPHELLQTFLSDGSGFVHIILEDIKR